MPLPLLAGDVGGTNTRLSLLSPDGKKVLRQAVEPSRGYPSLEAAVRAFLGRDRVRAACLGVAGPVIDGRCTATNLPWVIDERVLERRLAIGRVKLVNDLVAAAFGAIVTTRRHLTPLWGETLPRGKDRTIAILAPGTGLGEACLLWDPEGARHVPLATEGGHADFAPRDELEVRLLGYLRHRFGKRISYERVLSGPGIGNVFDFFVESERVRSTGAHRRFVDEAKDRNAAITELGLSGACRAAERTLETFASVLGAEAGNLALKCLPTGGLYLAGGIAGRLCELLARGAFAAAYLDKGRMEGLLRQIPVAVVLDGHVGLKGSARVAASLVRRAEPL